MPRRRPLLLVASSLVLLLLALGGVLGRRGLGAQEEESGKGGAPAAGSSPSGDVVLLEVPEAASVTQVLSEAGRALDMQFLWNPTNREFTEKSISPFVFTGTRAAVVAALRDVLWLQGIHLAPVTSQADTYAALSVHSRDSLGQVPYVELDEARATALEAQPRSIVSTFVPIEHLHPENTTVLSAQLERLLTPRLGVLVSVPSGRGLLVMDTAPRVAMVWRSIKAMDRPLAAEAARGVATTLVPLQHAAAGEIRRAIEAILLPLRPARPPAGTGAGPSPKPPVEGAPLRVTHDERLNLVILRGSPSQTEEALTIARRLDLPAPEADPTASKGQKRVPRVYDLPGPVERPSMWTNLLEAALRRPHLVSRPGTLVLPNPVKAASVLVLATPEDHQLVQEILAALQ